MKLAKRIAVLMCLMIVILPALAAADQDRDPTFLRNNPLLEIQCSWMARKYVTGDKEEAQQAAQKTLTSIETKYKEDPSKKKEQLYKRISPQLDLLKFIINGDDTAVRDYMHSTYFIVNDESIGLEFGPREALAVHENELKLIAAEPLYDKSSISYVTHGTELVQELYLDGEKEKAKMLASELLSLIKQDHFHDHEEPGWIIATNFTRGDWTKEGYLTWTKENEEEYLNNVLNDNEKFIVSFKLPKSYLEDSIGVRLEEAYGKIYLYRKLHIADGYWPYAYNRLARVQAIAGNYDESNRAYKAALHLATYYYNSDHPEILLEIRSQWAGMLKVAGKTEEAEKIAAGVTQEQLEKLQKGKAELLPPADLSCLWWNGDTYY